MSYGKIIKQGSFSTRRDCSKGTLTLFENRIKFECEDEDWTYSYALERLRTFVQSVTTKGIRLNRQTYRVDEPEEWIEAIKDALTAQGLKFRVSGYRVQSD